VKGEHALFEMKQGSGSDRRSTQHNNITLLWGH